MAGVFQAVGTAGGKVLGQKGAWHRQGNGREAHVAGTETAVCEAERKPGCTGSGGVLTSPSVRWRVSANTVRNPCCLGVGSKQPARRFLQNLTRVFDCGGSIPPNVGPLSQRCVLGGPATIGGRRFLWPPVKRREALIKTDILKANRLIRKVTFISSFPGVPR